MLDILVYRVVGTKTVLELIILFSISYLFQF